MVSPILGPSLTWGYADAPKQAAIVAEAWAGDARLLARRALEARCASADERQSALTQSRLRLVSDALEHNLNSIDEWLQPIVGLAAPRPEVAAAARHRGTNQPRRLRFTASLAYLFRDWVWGADEVHAGLDPIVATMRARHAAGEILVLGAGAMRLPWELTQAFPQASVTAVERNPVLCIAAARLLSGSPVDLWEVPVEPRNHRLAAIRHSLDLPSPHARGAPLALVLGDAREWSPDAPVDWLVTPFVLDVAGDSVIDLIERWTGWLRPGGYWIHHGPLSFRRPWQAGAYTIDEMLDALPACGLTVEHIETWYAPHLSSPADARLLGFHGTTVVAQKAATRSGDH